ncbi:response regulator transcription factor [Streptomyces zhihengii]|uniref:response regulator transcription factor n=1 Tax=Streptomyces zhihengii TaxID=1818004 RepID=UPI001FD397C1|nr:response regulator transcription factor [Streptomyces zhihengii]
MVVSVIIADDSEIVRRGLGDILASAADVHVVGQAWDGRSAVDMARRTSPDVALMDIRMPGMDGLTATRELRALPVPPAILILTSFGGDAYVDEALRAGAHGFLLKDSPPEELLRAVRHVARGHGVLDPVVAGPLLERFAERDTLLTDQEQRILDSLSDKDRRLLALIGRGLANAEIGELTHASEGTVKNQVSRLLRKIGAENRVRAARFAYRAGLEG